MNHVSKTALITGGAKGIGLAVSQRLAAAGWNLVVCGRDTAAMQRLAQSCQANQPMTVRCIAVDLGAPDGVASLFEALGTKTHVSALICNAGTYGALGPLQETDFAAWRASFDLNFFSVAELIQRYLKLPAPPSPQRRKIVVMGGSGLGGPRVWPGASAYACAKAAVYRLVEVVHEEMYDQGVDINCVAPGAVKTGMTEQAARAGRQALGALYDESVEVLQNGGHSPELTAATIAVLLGDRCHGVSGRLISAKWDSKFLEVPEQILRNSDLLRLRRIDGQLFTAVERTQ